MTRKAQGLRAWLWQRVSAVYMTVYLVYFGVHLTVAPPRSYGAWHDWMAGPVVTMATALFLGALLIHAWVGIRDVILDYAHSLALRLTLLTIAALGLIGSGLWMLKTLYALST